MVTIFFFALSFAFCTLMIVLRFMEMKRQKSFITTEYLNTVDAVVQNKLNLFKVDFLKRKQEAVFFITHHIPFYAWNQARDLTSGLRKRYEKIERTVRGRDMIKQTGEASDFIKTMTEHKNKIAEDVTMREGVFVEEDVVK